MSPGPLWYNGDFNGVNGLANEMNTSLGNGLFNSVYDNFVVTDSGGWNVTFGLLRQSVKYQRYRARAGKFAPASLKGTAAH